MLCIVRDGENFRILFYNLFAQSGLRSFVRHPVNNLWLILTDFNSVGDSFGDIPSGGIFSERQQARSGVLMSEPGHLSSGVLPGFGSQQFGQGFERFGVSFMVPFDDFAVSKGLVCRRRFEQPVFLEVDGLLDPAVGEHRSGSFFDAVFKGVARREHDKLPASRHAGPGYCGLFRVAFMALAYAWRFSGNPEDFDGPDQSPRVL